MGAPGDIEANISLSSFQAIVFLFSFNMFELLFGLNNHRHCYTYALSNFEKLMSQKNMILFFGCSLNIYVGDLFVQHHFNIHISLSLNIALVTQFTKWVLIHFRMLCRTSCVRKLSELCMWWQFGRAENRSNLRLLP